MKLLGKYGKDGLAILYIAEIDGKIVEFVESQQPPVPREKKWVLILSMLYGCPMKCLMCDAGGYYHGKVSRQGMIDQIDYMVRSRFPDGKVPIEKFKIQFARMGEPTLNEHVLDVLRELPELYDAPGLMPCLSTVAPAPAEGFLDELITIKDDIYPTGHFQLQFSIHSTDEDVRRKWMPANIWSLEDIQDYGENWYKKGDRHITLNFAVASDSVIDPDIILHYFKPTKYFIKLTPVNPTNRAQRNELRSGITAENSDHFPLAQEFRKRGYKTLISIGAWEENNIGTNCGQFATNFRDGQVMIKEGYTTRKYQLS